MSDVKQRPIKSSVNADDWVVLQENCAGLGDEKRVPISLFGGGLPWKGRRPKLASMGCSISAQSLYEYWAPRAWAADGYINQLFALTQGGFERCRTIGNFCNHTDSASPLSGSGNSDDFCGDWTPRKVVPQESFSIGTTYKIKTLGSTNWTAIGASASPAVGEIFVKNATPATGTGGDAYQVMTYGYGDTVKDVVSTANLVPGKTYRVLTLGSGVNWTSIGANPANVGQFFTKNDTAVSATTHGTVSEYYRCIATSSTNDVPANTPSKWRSLTPWFCYDDQTAGSTSIETLDDYGCYGTNGGFTDQFLYRLRHGLLDRFVDTPDVFYLTDIFENDIVHTYDTPITLDGFVYGNLNGYKSIDNAKEIIRLIKERWPDIVIILSNIGPTDNASKTLFASQNPLVQANIISDWCLSYSEANVIVEDGAAELFYGDRRNFRANPLYYRDAFNASGIPGDPNTLSNIHPNVTGNIKLVKDTLPTIGSLFGVKATIPLNSYPDPHGKAFGPNALLSRGYPVGTTGMKAVNYLKESGAANTITTGAITKTTGGATFALSAGSAGNVATNQVGVLTDKTTLVYPIYYPPGTYNSGYTVYEYTSLTTAIPYTSSQAVPAYTKPSLNPSYWTAGASVTLPCMSIPLPSDGLYKIYIKVRVVDTNNAHGICNGNSARLCKVDRLQSKSYGVNQLHSSFDIETLQPVLSVGDIFLYESGVFSMGDNELLREIRAGLSMPTMASAAPGPSFEILLMQCVRVG